MADRSTQVTLNNRTPLNLSRTYANLDHGIWTNNVLPPENIPPQEPSSWEAESDGFMTGVQGTVTYKLEGVGDVVITWDNPFQGSNSYTKSAPTGYEISLEGGSGDNAQVTFTLVKV
jgi:hypothetical protein